MSVFVGAALLAYVRTGSVAVLYRMVYCSKGQPQVLPLVS